MKYAANILPIITAVAGTVLGGLIEGQFQIDTVNWIVSLSTIGMALGIFIGLMLRDHMLKRHLSQVD